MKHKTLTLLATLLMLSACNQGIKETAQQSKKGTTAIIPQPQKLTKQEGYFLLTEGTKIILSDETAKLAAQYSRHRDSK